MSTQPWRPWLLAAAIVGAVLGAGGVWLAWYGAAGEVTLEAQVAWLNLGVIAIVTSGLAIVALLREARIRITDERRRLLRTIREPDTPAT